MLYVDTNISRFKDMNKYEVSPVGELNVGITEFVEYKYNYYYLHLANMNKTKVL